MGTELWTGTGSHSLSLTAYWGGDDGKSRCVQLTGIRGWDKYDHVCMTRGEAKDVVAQLTAWLEDV